MEENPFTAIGAASAVFALSKTARGLGVILSKPDRDTQPLDTSVKNLADQVRLLGIESNLVYSELEVVHMSTTGSSPCNDFEHTTWHCITAQVEEAQQTMQELRVLVQTIKDAESSLNTQRKLDSIRVPCRSIANKMGRHINVMRIAMPLITTVRTLTAPSRTDWPLSEKLENLQASIRLLQRSIEANLPPSLSYTEATFVRCAQEVISKGITSLEASPAEKSVDTGSRAPNSSERFTGSVHTLESLYWHQQGSQSPHIDSRKYCTLSSDGTDGTMPNQVSTRHDLEDGFDDDLEFDLIKAALDTGNTAYEMQEWNEAESLLQEALKILQRLPNRQYSFFDIFNLHYKLAVCSYYTKEAAIAEEALTSLVQRPASTDEQFECIYNATHLLSQLYIRIGQVDRARFECEKAFKARRWLLGKQSEAALESMALMAHIQVLLNNRALAKSYLAMIPEERREAIIEAVEKSLGTGTEHLDFPTLLNQRAPESSNAAAMSPQSSISTCIIESPDTDICNCSQFTLINSPSGIHRHEQSCSLSHAQASQPVSMLPQLSIHGATVEQFREKQRHSEVYLTSEIPFDPGSLGPEVLPQRQDFKGKLLSRNEILDKIGCHPKDQIEETVCNGDHLSLASLLSKRKNSWRSKLRKHGRSERVTALHFAALFGEIDMARLLVSTNFNVNEVPYGYSTNLTPLKFAIGARQVDMVEFLITSGAKPSEPDSWSTLAAQLLSRSWLMKTMSEIEKEYVPARIIAIMSILLKNGWDVNMPHEASGGTLLHLAVMFWTGSYHWDLNIRATISSFLCAYGANPFQADAEGHTPYDKAAADGNHDLLLILNRDPKKPNLQGETTVLAELVG